MIYKKTKKPKHYRKLNNDLINDMHTVAVIETKVLLKVAKLRNKLEMLKLNVKDTCNMQHFFKRCPQLQLLQAE